jgi:cyclic dehypoxanthinyl futalosine synthase
MNLVREWQDDAIHDLSDQGGGKYMAFISWPFQPSNTALGRVKEWGFGTGDDLSRPFPGDAIARLDGQGKKTDHPQFGKRRRVAGASAYLRTQALSRLFLDNIYSIGSSWVTMGPHVGQMGLLWGANDMGSVMMEENVVSSAGSTHCLNEPMICRLIRDAGYVPAQRDNAYDLLKVHDGPTAPDLSIADWSTCRPDRLLREQGAEEAGGCSAASGTPEAADVETVSLTIQSSD